MKLYIEDEEPTPAIKYLDNADPAPSGYTNTVDPGDWNRYLQSIMDYDDALFMDVRNEMINQFESNWNTYSDNQKKDLIENYIWPSELSNSELDDLYDGTQRDHHQNQVMIKLNIGVIHIIKSDTSVKHFIITATDSGTIGLLPITTDTTI